MRISLGWGDRQSRFLPPLRGFHGPCPDPTAGTVGYFLPLLRSFTSFKKLVARGVDMFDQGMFSFAIAGRSA